MPATTQAAKSARRELFPGWPIARSLTLFSQTLPRVVQPPAPRVRELASPAATICRESDRQTTDDRRESLPPPEHVSWLCFTTHRRSFFRRAYMRRRSRAFAQWAQSRASWTTSWHVRIDAISQYRCRERTRYGGGNDSRRPSVVCRSLSRQIVVAGVAHSRTRGASSWTTRGGVCENKVRDRAMGHP